MMESLSTRPVLLRRLSIVTCAFLAIVLAVRDQSARAPSEHALASLGSLWKSHPDQLRRMIGREASIAATTGKPISELGLGYSSDLLGRSPLSSLPLMIFGAEAQFGGDALRAERLYRASRIRNPRDASARLLLANSMLRRGEVAEGLAEMLALARIIPRSAGPIAPALAEYAKTAGAIRALRPVLDANPGIRSQVLVLLAQDAANASLIVQLAPKNGQAPTTERPWEGVLLNSLVSAGRVVEARALWHQMSGLGQRDELLLNPTFAKWQAPPPFNWEMPSASGGIAEIGDKPGLSIVYYGRDEVALARQMLALEPGKYRLGTQTEGVDALDSLVWALSCQDGKAITTLPIANPGSFEVPTACPAQWLTLKGMIPDEEVTVETRILSVTLQRISG
jgi:pentatricopeptide repeat protein